MINGTDTPLLSDGTLSLRALEPGDIDTIFEWENDTRLWTSATTAAPFSRRNIEDYVLTYDADIFSAKQLRLMVCVDGVTVGAADLFDFDPVNRRAGIGLVIGEPFRRRGYALRALALLSRYCRERIGMHQLWALVGADNAPSRAMLTAAGYEISGRMRSWLRTGTSYGDAYFYQLLLP